MHYFSVIASKFSLKNMTLEFFPKRLSSFFHLEEPTLNTFLIFSPKKLFLCYMKCNFIALSLKTSCVSGGNFPSTKDKRKRKKIHSQEVSDIFLKKTFSYILGK